MANQSSNQRHRNFATIVYPESAPEDWQSRLEDFKIPALISPIHDRDINQSSEQEYKKPHYHVILMFSSMKSEKQVRDIINCFGGVGCEAINAIRGYVRYLCHLDNPEKAQYNERDVIALYGADYYNLISLTTDKYKAMDEIIDFCIATNTWELGDLADFAKFNNPIWFRFIVDNTIFLREYLRSKRYSIAARTARLVESEESNYIATECKKIANESEAVADEI